MPDHSYSTNIARYYIDTRHLVPQPDGAKKIERSDIPLISSLPEENQIAIMKFMRPEDKFMSLASALLKFTFIHRTAKVSWSNIRISRTPRPHGRPYWDPPPGWKGDGFDGVEFNVSHQAGVVILAGSQTPGRPETSLGMSQHSIKIIPDPSQQEEPRIRIGVDVACTKEPRRTQDFSTQGKLDQWVDIFSDMFSLRERTDMKEREVSDIQTQSNGFNSDIEVLEHKGRRFYTHWALKEAYIKMVGEGLLADWLRDLEFINVVSPCPGERLLGHDTTLRTLFKGKDVSNYIGIELEGFEDSFLFTMITQGLAEPMDVTKTWSPLTIDDIAPCAEGRCSCLL